MSEPSVKVGDYVHIVTAYGDKEHLMGKSGVVKALPVYDFETPLSSPEIGFDDTEETIHGYECWWVPLEWKLEADKEI